VQQLATLDPGEREHLGGMRCSGTARFPTAACTEGPGSMRCNVLTCPDAETRAARTGPGSAYGRGSGGIETRATRRPAEENGRENAGGFKETAAGPERERKRARRRRVPSPSLRRIDANGGWQPMPDEIRDARTRFLDATRGVEE
jgi:hypothetical protein